MWAWKEGRASQREFAFERAQRPHHLKEKKGALDAAGSSESITGKGNTAKIPYRIGGMKKHITVQLG